MPWWLLGVSLVATTFLEFYELRNSGRAAALLIRLWGGLRIQEDG